MKPLIQRLREYSGCGAYPFHMPGHKRQAMGGEPELSGMFSVDITEIGGFDDLHHPEGILKDSMEWAARRYGADESRYLVNGSSSGILSAVCGCVSRGGKILIGRNCHKSVYHGVFLNGLKTEYIYPQILEELGIQGGILPGDVEKKLQEHRDIQAVVIVSPTYDGMVSDIEKIAETVHGYGIPLLVDEAHGAHFSFGNDLGFPPSALDKGADVVVQSLHKTLPSPTQTAILHMKGKYLAEEKRERIRRYLSIYQTSSPSYVFMAAMENCIRYMAGEGRERLGELFNRLEDFYRECKGINHMLIPGKEYVGKGGIYDQDHSKIILYTGYGEKNGVWLGNYLRENYHLELEMCMPQYALALSSLWDVKEGFKRLAEGIYGADKEIGNYRKTAEADSEGFLDKQIVLDTVYSIEEAMELETELCRIEYCAGKVSAEFIYVYPPGIPYVVPGELLGEEMIRLLIKCKESGLDVRGVEKWKGDYIKVVKERSVKNIEK